MNIYLWTIYSLSIGLLVLGLKKGITHLFAFRGNFESISFMLGLLTLGFAFAQTSGFFSGKAEKILDSNFDEEFHNDFSKVGSGVDKKSD